MLPYHTNTQVDEYLSKTYTIPHGEGEGTERKGCKDRSANGFLPVLL